MNDDRKSWNDYQPGLVGSTAPRNGDDVAKRRYELEPHILDVVPFRSMSGRVAEFGCGIGTDGLLISQSARSYIGLDYSALALDTARQRHAGLESSFTRADLCSVPLRAATVDFVYSHGVLHHLRDGDVPWGEFGRALKRGGGFCVMVYHRRSINYYYGILLLRRVLLLLTFLFPRFAQRIALGRGETEVTLKTHLEYLRSGPMSYLFGPQWLSRNTDGPQNTYSRVYSERELRKTISAAGLQVDRIEVRYLNERVNPPFSWLPGRLKERLGRIFGWHLYAIGHKP